MKINQEICITGKRTVLVPYRKEHVTKYHGWMQNEELQELTASEPLTLQEEYAMQHSWSEDEQKCTFIILDAGKFKNNKENEIESMVGDVNLFFNDIDDKYSAEVEIMVAGW
ncbi:hypothetical protein NP493_101g08008 [Ridgeia piscesae]|uniref:N-acetyltransferase domain-containing protein n=1 Tax=Ridgeia piscesae TaxID=27915 RepID=A0AAD9P7K6_RIDPI|nr:hypothetical protein NP493_101g08008 [Ridgeia piscesae]